MADKTYMEKSTVDWMNCDPDKLYKDLNPEKAEVLLKDENDLGEESLERLKKIKREIIENEFVNLSDEDVLSDIKLLKENIPKELTPLEKVRWLYINIGKLFSYDYRVANDPKYGYGKKINTNEFINRYQTCVQISEILNKVFNGELDDEDFPIEGVESKTIKRILMESRGQYGEDHVANEVIVDSTEGKIRLMLDLTLDLYLIQSDCYTKHFGYEDDGTGYDIISKVEDIEMDKKLGFVMDENDYTDTRINNAKELIKEYSKTFGSSKDFVEYKVKLINQLTKKFVGYNEGKLYLDMLLKKLLKEYYKEFNLYYNKEGEVNLKTVYAIISGDYEKWIMYSNRLGLVSTSQESLRNMLEGDWQTNSSSLLELVKNEKKY